MEKVHLIKQQSGEISQYSWKYLWLFIFQCVLTSLWTTLMPRSQQSMASWIWKLWEMFKLIKPICFNSLNSRSSCKIDLFILMILLATCNFHFFKFIKPKLFLLCLKRSSILNLQRNSALRLILENIRKILIILDRMLAIRWFVQIWKMMRVL